MKFHVEGVILNIRDLVQQIRPILTAQLYSNLPGINQRQLTAMCWATEEWVLKRLMEDRVGCDIVGYWRRNQQFEPHFYALRHQLPTMEVEFSAALLEALPLHLIPNHVEVIYRPDCLFIRKANLTPFFWG